MKKLFLLTCTSLIALSANAQTDTNKPGGFQQPTETVPMIPQNVKDALAAGKTIAEPEDNTVQRSNLPYRLNPMPFFDYRVTVSVPSTFVKADDQLIKSQYPDASNLPKIVFTDKTKRPLLAMNMSDNGGDRDDIVHFFRDVKNDIRTKYPTSRFLKTDVIRGRTLAIIEVILPNKDGQNIYNMMAFRYIGNEFFFLNFTCPEEDMPQWQDTAREISENIKVNSPK